MSKTEQKQLTAAQRLQGLEQSLYVLDSAIGNMGRQMSLLQSAVMLLGDKFEAMVEASSRGMAMSDSVLDTLMEEKAIIKLKGKIDSLVTEGRLVKSEQAIDDMSMVVAREIDGSTGEVLNPRIQFAIGALIPESKVALMGKKAGESVKPKEDSPNVIEIEEVYQIMQKEEEATQPTQEG